MKGLLARILFVFSTVSWSVLAGPADTASVVVLAHVAAGKQTGTLITATIEVDKVLKGGVFPGQALSIQTSNFWKSSGTLAGSGMWFLTASENPGIWNIVPIMHGRVPFELMHIPIAREDLLAQGMSFPADIVSVHDRVVTELVPKLERLSPGSAEFDIVASALFSLPRSSLFLSQMAGLLRHPAPEVQAIALTGLLRGGKSEYLAQVLALPRGVNGPINAELSSAISNTTDQAVQSINLLSAIAGSGGPWKKEAATALSRIHSAKTLPCLFQLLADPDESIQVLAVSGFSMFVQNLPVKTGESVVKGSWLNPVVPVVFRTPETDQYSIITNVYPNTVKACAGFWRSWYLANQAKIQ